MLALPRPALAAFVNGWGAAQVGGNCTVNTSLSGTAGATQISAGDIVIAECLAYNSFCGTPSGGSTNSWTDAAPSATNGNNGTYIKWKLAAALDVGASFVTATCNSLVVVDLSGRNTTT